MDNKMRWLSRLSPLASRAGKERAAALLYTQFPCGLIRGALASFGVDALVTCSFDGETSTLPACQFTVKVAQSQSPPTPPAALSRPPL
ncbi:hypothetical protein T492DRAFT_1063913 [Pavlovales sp. CCMP2436]|nr:hypothetical protein T492DRAFT_1063913 [Pavlovales sp. CCMP2436]